MEFFAIDPIDVTVYVTVQDRFGKHSGFCANMLAFHSFCHVKQVSHGCRGMSMARCIKDIEFLCPVFLSSCICMSLPQ
jgi:hypothetical protein